MFNHLICFPWSELHCLHTYFQILINAPLININDKILIADSHLYLKDNAYYKHHKKFEKNHRTQWLYLNQTLYHHIVAPDQTMQVGHFLRTYSYHPINHRAIMMVYSYDPLMNLQFFLSLYDKFLHHPLSIDLDLPIYLLNDLNVVQQI